MGVALLDRSPRGVEPTAAGRYLLGASSRVLGEVAEITSTLARFGAGTVGALTLAAVPALMWHRVPRLLRAYAVEAPEVEISVTAPPPWEAVDRVQQRTADLAAILVADRKKFRARHRHTLEVHDWGDIPLVAVLPAECAEVSDPLPVKAFDSQVLVLPQRTAAVPSLPEVVEAALRRFGVTPRAVRTADTIQAGMALIEAGLGWGVLPDPDRKSLQRFAVTVRPLEQEVPALHALLLSRPGSAHRPAEARFLRLAMT